MRNNRQFVKYYLQSSEVRHSGGRAVDNSELIKDNKLDLLKFSELFMQKEKDGFTFKVIEDFLEGNIIELEIIHQISIAIRLDQTGESPACV